MKQKKLSLEEQQNISYEILVDIDSYCKKNNITYFLACGTLLGAIRHGDFIPWDDDVDIMMPRKDYNYFLNNYRSDRFRLYKPSEGRLYYAKVYDANTIKYEVDIDYKKYPLLGVDVDVFPLDGMVNDENVVNKLYKKECFLETLLRLSNQPIFNRKNPIKAINRIIPRIIGSKRLVRMIEKNAQTYNYDNSEYVIRMRWSPNGFTGALPKSVYEKDYKKFRGQLFCVPKEYDLWLKKFFGDDYMELPPVSKRKGHGSECYIKEEEENE